MGDAENEWPGPAEELWLVHGVMGAAVGMMDGNGVGTGVLLRVAARRNKSDEQLDITLALDQSNLVRIMAALIAMGQQSFGQAEMQQAMAEYLLREGS